MLGGERGPIEEGRDPVRRASSSQKIRLEGQLIGGAAPRPSRACVQQRQRYASEGSESRSVLLAGKNGMMSSGRRRCGGKDKVGRLRSILHCLRLAAPSPDVIGSQPLQLRLQAPAIRTQAAASQLRAETAFGATEAAQL